MSTRRAVLIGAGLAVLGVVVAGVLIATGVLGTSQAADSAMQGPVLVALVLRDQSGVQQPRMLDVYTKSAVGWELRSVSPTLPATVSGTSGTTLADAYSFGGGRALTAAYSALGRGPASAWIVVDESAWEQLLGGQPFQVDVPAHMEVFDGRQLTPFEQGSASVPATQTSALLQGASYLSRTDNALLRASVGDALAGRLASAGVRNAGLIASDMGEQRLASWLQGLGSPTRAAGD